VLLCLFQGLVAALRVYYSLDLLLSKLSKAQSTGKFRERHSTVGFSWRILWSFVIYGVDVTAKNDLTESKNQHNVTFKVIKRRLKVFRSSCDGVPLK
jgi:hypothetical protein